MKNQKEMVADYAVNKYVKSNKNIGIGTGSSVSFLIKKLSEKIKTGKVKNIKLYPTSTDTKILLLKSGLNYESNLAPLDKLIDITIDGADEILIKNKALIKGKGGASLMEKVIAYNSKKLIIIADETKIVERLGEKSKIPIEIVPNALNFILKKIKEMGFNAKIRECETKKGPIITDNNNYIVDIKMNIENPKDTEKYFKLFPGVVDIGIFTHKNISIIYYRNGKIEEV